ncbi:MAG: DUF4328 domain-containing protein [Ilumatobacteraceae bacterium]
MSDFPPPPPPTIPPPPPSAPSGYVNAQQPLQRIGGVARSLAAVMGAMAVFQAFGVIDSIRLVNKAQQFLDGTISEDAYTDATARIGLSTLTPMLTVAAAVLTMVWMVRIGKNLRSIGRQGLSWSPAWGIWGWFTPPCIHVVPWLVLQEQWKASDPDIAPGDSSWKQRPVSPLVHAWWALYGLVPLVSSVVSISSVWDSIRTALESGFDESDTTRAAAQTLVDGRVTGLITGLAQTVAAVVFMLLVRQQTARHMRCTGEA